MRKVSYIRTEFHAPDESIENDLLSFCYDVPYLDACGILPPLHIINQIFKSGGENGGMGPGATWNPFEISAAEYNELASSIIITPLDKIPGNARYKLVKFELDSEFDHIQDWMVWIQATCKKHKEEYDRKYPSVHVAPESQ